MPNTFSYVALFSWPLVTFVLFRLLSRPYALIASILGGYLLLPFAVGVDFSLLPTFDKTSIPSLSAAIAAVLFARRSPSGRSAQMRLESEPARDAQRAHVHATSNDNPWSRRIERILLGPPFYLSDRHDLVE